MNSHHQSTDAVSRDEPRPDAFVRDQSHPHDLLVSTPITPKTDVQDPIEEHRHPVIPSLEPNEPSRPSSAEREQARPNAVNRDEARTNASERDQTLGDYTAKQEEPEANWLDVEQATALLGQKGISRTIRTIQKMCKRGDLLAKLVPTENGTRYIINEQSIDDFVIRHNEKLPSGSLETENDTVSAVLHGMNTPEASEPGTQPNGEQVPAAAQSSELHHSHLREIIDLKNQQITMLQSQMDIANAQIAVKDEQIGEMLERDHETNHLIQNLQRMIGLPAGRTSSQFDDSAIDVDRGSTHARNG